MDFIYTLLGFFPTWVRDAFVAEHGGGGKPIPPEIVIPPW